MKYFYSSVFFQHLALGMVFPVIAAWQNQQGLNFTQIGWLFGLSQVVHLAFDPLSSYISDFYSKKFVLIAGLLCLMTSILALAVSSSVGMFILFTVLHNIGLAFMSGTEESLLHDLWSAKHGSFTKWLSKMHIYDEAGTIVGTLCSSLFILFFNVTFNFFAAALILAIASLFIFLVRIHGKIPGGTVSTAQQGIVQLISYVRSYKLIFLVIMVSAVSVITFRSEIVYQKALIVTGISLGVFGLVYALAKASSIGGSLIADTVEKKFGTFQAMSFIFLLQTGGLFLLFFGSVWAVVLSLCVFYFAENIFRGIFRAWILNNAPEKIKTICLSLCNMVTLGVWALLNPLTGFALNKSFVLAVVILIVLRLVSICVMRLTRNRLFVVSR